MLPSIKRRLAALGPVAIPFADTTPGIWLLETQPAPKRPAPAPTLHAPRINTPSPWPGTVACNSTTATTPAAASSTTGTAGHCACC